MRFAANSPRATRCRCRSIPWISPTAPVWRCSPALAARRTSWVNNAGAIPADPLAGVGEDVWRAAWDLKVFGYINLCRALYPAMASRRRGVIINVVGIAGGEITEANYIAGTAGNASLAAFTRALGGSSRTACGCWASTPG